MAIVPAGSPAFLDVQAAYNACNNGDTLSIPRGTATWGQGGPQGVEQVLTVAKQIQIIGFGMDQTNATPTGANATIITNTNASGKLIATNYPGGAANQYTCRISGLVFELTTFNTAYMFSLNGKAFRHRDANNNIVGGLRVDHLRIRNSADSGAFPIAASALLFAWSGPAAGSGAGNYITGSFDHNFIDYQVGSKGSEVNTFGCSGSPDGTIDGQGQYNWCQDYTYGGGDDTELQVIYVEDNIFHKGGFCLGTLAGGVRLIVRHNTSWGGLNGHGMDSGGNMGPASWEAYNNNIIRKTTFNAAAFNQRGGANVHVNNRASGYGSGNDPAEMALSIFRPSSTNSAVVGNGSGRNFFDENYKGAQVFNGVNFFPTLTEADSRIGDVYASGNGCTVNGLNFTLNGLDGTNGGQSTLGNVWAGFTLVNTSTASAASAGEQGKNTSAQSSSYGMIIASNNNASNCTVTVQGSATTNINLTAGNTWEIRRVKTYFCAPGAGKIPFAMNGGNNLNILPNTGNPDTTGAAFIADNGAPLHQHKYWSNQFGFGLWHKFNLCRPTGAANWSGANPFFVDPTTVLALKVPGGMHNEALPPYKKNDGTGGVSYPIAPANDANYRRVGADWNAPGIDPGTGQPYAEQINVGDDGQVTQAYGGVYPNSMVATTVVLAPVINSLLTASSTIASSFSYFITASNSPTSFGATQLPAGYAVDASTGEITCTAANNIGQPGDYNVLISAANTGGTGTATLVITLSGTASTQRGKGRAHRIATAARRF